MYKRRCEDFLKLYSELDSLLCERLSVEREGITEYINRLGDGGGGFKRSQVLHYLVRYRAAKCELEGGAENGAKQIKIGGDDIARLRSYIRTVSRGGDPLSLKMKKAERKALPMAKRVLLTAIPIVAVALLVALIILLCNLLINN